MLLTAGEETGCQGARGMVHSGLDMKGAGAIVVAEPTSNQPLLGHKGALWLKLKIAGLSAHGSMPEEGDNALLKGAYLATHLANYRFPSMPHRHLSKATLNVSKFLSGKSINVVPDYAELSVDIRTTPGMQHDEVLGDISRYVAPHEVTFERLLDLPNVWSDEQDPWIQSVFRLLERLQGRPPQPKGASYFTDACIFAPASDNAPTLILGPGDPTMAHQTDEYCNIAQIHEAVAIYSAIVADWCTGSSQLKQQDNVPTPTLEE
ncbi:MAG: M20 family metallopeptidase [Pigmentiphaga sp.]